MPKHKTWSAHHLLRKDCPLPPSFVEQLPEEASHLCIFKCRRANPDLITISLYLQRSLSLSRCTYNNRCTKCPLVCCKGEKTLQTAGGEAGGKGWAPTGKQKVVEVEALGFTERGWIAPSRRKIALTYWKQGEYSCFRSLQHGWFMRATNKQELEKVADWW